jgi:hypothetical protein
MSENEEGTTETAEVSTEFTKNQLITSVHFAPALRPLRCIPLRYSVNSAGNKTTQSSCVILRVQRATKPRHPSALFCEFSGQQNHAILLRYSASSAGNKTTPSSCAILRVLRATKPRNTSALFCEFSFDGAHDKCGKKAKQSLVLKLKHKRRLHNEEICVGFVDIRQAPGEIHAGKFENVLKSKSDFVVLAIR